MCLRLPQELNETYTRRCDELIENFLCKVKIIDDILAYETNIERSFFHTWEYLRMCAKNNIVINKTQFQFCQDNVELVGLYITQMAYHPLESY